MMLSVLLKMGFSENSARQWIEKYTRSKTVVSAVFYILMVFIVIFGMSANVYAGFPKVVPYIIMVIFMFMAFVRMYQCLVDDGYIKKMAAQKSEMKEKKEKKEKKADEKAAETDASEESVSAPAEEAPAEAEEENSEAEAEAEEPAEEEEDNSEAEAEEPVEEAVSAEYAADETRFDDGGRAED